ncbi:hypothetical protein BGX28_000240 [Mortierella sp. GBA30]|nr:hypothetical protein BGX28_000240 [Mortierella sp. GBA30]
MSTYPSQPPPLNDGRTPHVMIVGAGLSGLLLAILLERANIPFEIYERAKEVKPLGSLMSINASILAALDQLGLLEELEKISLPNSKMTVCGDDLKIMGVFETVNEKEILGYNRVALARPELHDLLMSKIAPERFHFGKKVMSVAQSKDGVMIRCNDGTTYHGDILVGADGAYSGVRQGLYKLLQQEDQLPSSDAVDLSKGFICMVGTTDPLDPSKYPGVNNPQSNAFQVIGKGTQYTWSAFSVPNNRICWNVVVQLTTMQHEDEKFRNSEWGPESNESLIKEVESFKTPYNCTMGDLIAQTPRDGISKVFLEDKLFETWHYGRTVLIGDAAHKLLPSSGQGAVTAMQDAVVLANCLYDLQSLETEDIKAAFQEYKDQRYAPVKEQYDASKMNAKIVYGQTWFERTIRYVIFNYMPKSVLMRNVTKGTALRPQAVFLPFVPNRGTCPVFSQKPSKRYMEEQAKAKAATAISV